MADDPDDLEVVWNGALDRRHASATPAPAAPKRVGGGQAKFLRYLETHPEALHDSHTVATALEVSQTLASAWLVRACRRGQVRQHAVEKRGGRPAIVYRVVVPETVE